MNDVKKYSKIEHFIKKCQKKEKSFSKKPNLRKNQKAEMAFEFWKLIKGNCYLNNQQDRREFLKQFTSNTNEYIALVAMIESLPVSIFRRIRARHNINYESLFSFLRRISPENMQAIKDNYTDLLVDNRQPRVLKFYEKWQKKFSVKMLVEENDNWDLRNAKKGSWSFNLLGLDFGFKAYKNDLSNDTLTEAKTWMDFLSIKNHSNDFIVDREFGKYWWFYRTARSNPGWKKNKIIELSDHICPGFWYTLFIHSLFWVISPLIFTYAFTTTWQIAIWTDLLSAIPIFLIASFTPLWLISTTIQTLIRLIMPERKRKQILEKIVVLSDTKFFKILEKIIESYVPCVITFFVMFVITSVAQLSWFFFLPSFGPIGSIVLTLLLLLYFGSHIINERLVDFEERGVVFKIIYASAAFYVLVLFFVHFHDYVEQAIKFLFSFFVLSGVAGIILAALILIPFLAIVLCKYLENNVILKKIVNSSLALMIMLVLPGLYCIRFSFSLMADVAKNTQLFPEPILVAGFVFSFWVLYLVLFFNLFFNLYQKDTDIEYRLKYEYQKDKHYNPLFFWQPLSGLRLRWYLRHNQNWKSLNLEAQADLLNSAYVLLNNIVEYPSDRKKYLCLLLPVLSHAMIKKIENCNLEYIHSNEKRFLTFYFLTEEFSFEETQTLCHKELENHRKIEEKIQSVIDAILKPFTLIYEKVSQLVWIKKKFF